MAKLPSTMLCAKVYAQLSAYHRWVMRLANRVLKQQHNSKQQYNTCIEWKTMQNRNVHEISNTKYKAVDAEKWSLKKT